jgi:hypothetical protein
LRDRPQVCGLGGRSPRRQNSQRMRTVPTSKRPRRGAPRSPILWKVYSGYWPSDANHADENFEILICTCGRELYRQPTRGGFSTVGTIVTIHRCGLRDRSSRTDRTMPKNLDPFKLSSAARPLYWTRRQSVASRRLVVSTVCTMTSSGHARPARYQSNAN